MSAQSARAYAPERDAVVSGLPRLRLVETPRRERGLIGTAVVCLLLFVGAVLTMFVINNSMVGTAYEMRSVNDDIRAAQAQEATLTDQVLSLSTPDGLQARATKLGMVPAPSPAHVDLKSGTILVATDGKAK